MIHFPSREGWPKAGVGWTLYRKVIENGIRTEAPGFRRDKGAVSLYTYPFTF